MRKKKETKKLPKKFEKKKIVDEKKLKIKFKT